MQFDGLLTHAIKQELKTELLGGRVNKIYQPFSNELIIVVRSKRKNHNLLLSTHSSYAHLQITKDNISNPPVPTSFTMSLRKYLEGSILEDVIQIQNDRIINLKFNHRNDLGDYENIILSIEMMNRHSNIILYQNNKIINTIKHVGPDQNRHRTLLPGAFYVTPPSQNKKNPFEIPFKEIKNVMEQFPNYEVLAFKLSEMLQGFSKDNILELSYRLVQTNEPETTWNNFLQGFDNDNIWYLLTDAENKLYVLPFKYEHLDIKNILEYPSLSQALDEYYKLIVNHERVQQRGQNLIKIVKTMIKKNKNKLIKLQNTLKNADNADDFKIKGEILTTYLYKIKNGMSTVNLTNFYDNDKSITIELSNQLTPSQNAQKYFKKYNKLKNSIDFVNEQVVKTKQEIVFLENIDTQIQLAKPDDLNAIDEELVREGYIKKNFKRKQKVRIKFNKPEEYTSSSDIKILVGKNDQQNDALTFNRINRNYYWAHAKDIPGSHVVIAHENPDDETILEAAQLAAYYSKNRNSDKVPVNVVPIKKIKKPNGSKPGYVIYTGQKTILVTPKIIKNNDVYTQS